MSSPKVTNISSLQQLRLEKERLTRESGLAKKAFGNSLIKSQKVTSSYLLKTVVAPVGVVGLAALLVNRLLSTDSDGSSPDKESSPTPPTPEVVPPPPSKTGVSAPSVPPLQPATPQRRIKPGPQSDSPKEGFNWSALLNAGKFLVPLVQIVIGIANREMSKGEEMEG